jgi:hypothetical protein
MKFAADLLARILEAQGCPNETSRKFIDAILGGMVEGGLLGRHDLERWERDAAMYHLRGQRMTWVQLSLRFGIDRANVFRAIRRHQANRRAMLRRAS